MFTELVTAGLLTLATITGGGNIDDKSNTSIIEVKRVESRTTSEITYYEAVQRQWLVETTVITQTDGRFQTDKSVRRINDPKSQKESEAVEEKKQEIRTVYSFGYREQPTDAIPDRRH